MKWTKNAPEGIVIAGRQGYVGSLTHLHWPYGIFLYTSVTLYVADSVNNRVLRWPQGATQGTAIVPASLGSAANQFTFPWGLSFDRQGNLYVADSGNNRVRRFSIQ